MQGLLRLENIYIYICIYICILGLGTWGLQGLRVSGLGCRAWEVEGCVGLGFEGK